MATVIAVLGLVLWGGGGAPSWTVERKGDPSGAGGTISVNQDTDGTIVVKARP